MADRIITIDPGDGDKVVRFTVPMGEGNSLIMAFIEDVGDIHIRVGEFDPQETTQQAYKRLCILIERALSASRN